ncbi:MAG: hypothetical protein KGK07_07295 [Chloroflexota bacterium]|nr:hypothetical protein [Chloroflexota bacterium]
MSWAVTPRRWQDMSDEERGIVRCDDCGLGIGAEHPDAKGLETYTCPECRPWRSVANTTEEAIVIFRNSFDHITDKAEAIEHGIHSVLTATVLRSPTDAENALRRVAASLRLLTREMDSDVEHGGRFSKDAWIHAYDDRLSYIRRVLALCEEAGA